MFPANYWPTVFPYFPLDFFQEGFEEVETVPLAAAVYGPASTAFAYAPKSTATVYGPTDSDTLGGA